MAVVEQAVEYQAVSKGVPQAGSLRRKVLRRLLLVAMPAALWFIVHTCIVAWIGLNDDLGKVDVIVVFGNTVNPDRSLSPRLKARMDRALELYKAGYAPAVLVSGGLGIEGHEEAVVMGEYLIACGMPEMSIVVDTDGYDSWKTARNAAAVMKERGGKSALLVTQYWHIARARMAFRGFGVTELRHAHARMGPELREPVVLVREFLAFYYYLVREYPESE